MFTFLQVVNSLLPADFDQNHVLFVLNGQGRLNIGEEKFSFSPGMAFAFRGTGGLALLSGGIESGYLLRFSDWQLSDFLLRYPQVGNIAREVWPMRIMFVQEHMSMLEQELGFLHSELAFGASRDRLRLLVSLILLRVFELAFPCGSDLSGKMDLVNEFKENLERYFRLQRSTRFYARKLAVSSRFLNDLCREWYAGKRMFEVVMERICMEAELLLSNFDIPVKVVAYELGFSSTHHFRMYFKRFRGISPSEFRFGLEKT